MRKFRDAVLDGELCVCPPFRLEARFSAQGGLDFARIDTTLNGFDQAEADDQTFALALTAQQDLAQARGISHRVKPVDLLVAAIAHQHGLGVLHYDKNYDALSSKSSLIFASKWIAPKGSLD
jgi:predicted nucleic acid-binding protein